MRKNIIGSTLENSSKDAHEWLDLDKLASVEVTSEASEWPIEGALEEGGPGWRAATPGIQTIRLVFDEPRTIQQMQVTFREADAQRTQEFSLSWVDAEGVTREILRQQWSFSPGGSTEEVEDYKVELSRARVLELNIRPDMTTPEQVVASLHRWRVA